MLRTPPRRQPRVAALVPSKGAYVLVVLDAWELRAAAITKSPTRLRRLLLQERPAVVVTAKAHAWLRRMRVAVEASPAPVHLLPLAAFPELRRFAGTVHERALRAAVTLANEALTHQRP